MVLQLRCDFYVCGFFFSPTESRKYALSVSWDEPSLRMLCLTEVPVLDSCSKCWHSVRACVCQFHFSREVDWWNHPRPSVILLLNVFFWSLQFYFFLSFSASYLMSFRTSSVFPADSEDWPTDFIQLSHYSFLYTSLKCPDLPPPPKEISIWGGHILIHLLSLDPKASQHENVWFNVIFIELLYRCSWKVAEF